jgi:hypothetical protein
LLGDALDREKLAQTIRKLIADRDADSALEREKTYAAARLALVRTANGDPASMIELESVIADIESSYRIDHPAVGPAGSVWRTFARVAMDVGIGAVVAAAIVAASPLLLDRDRVAGKLKYQYENALPQMQVAVDAINKVSAAVVRMQQADPEGLEAKSSQKFVSLNTIDPQLTKELPASLPVGSGIIVRADRKDYKILFNWTLCGVARIAKPEMVDPVRNRTDVLGCPYFGVWTEGAAKW